MAGGPFTAGELCWQSVFELTVGAPTAADLLHPLVLQAPPGLDQDSGLPERSDGCAGTGQGRGCALRCTMAVCEYAEEQERDEASF